ERSSTAKDGELTQKEEGIHPWKLLLLALMAIRFLIFSHVLDGKSPVKRLLEIFSACNGRSRIPLRWLKLTSRTVMLPDDISADGRPPERKLYDRLMCNKPVSSPRDGEMLPSRLLKGRETSITDPLTSQVMPSHLQQSVPSRHDMATPSSCVSPAMNWSRELFSCSLHEVARHARQISSTRGRPKKGITSLPPCLCTKN
ncbi:hypothetical protein EJB05_25226, partial [Eragrostis curvula]